MVKAHVAGIARATHERADRREVTSDLAVQNADATRTLNKVGRGEQHVDEFLNLGAQLVDGRERGELLLGQNVATHAADHVEAIGLAVTGELLGQVHGLLTDAEELLEARIEAGVVRCEANVEQMRVQALDLEHDSADILGARRDMDALGTLDGLGVGHRVGAAADAADAVGEERHGVIVQARLGDLLHAAVHVEQTVVGIDDRLALNEQAEVAGLVGGDVQRSHGDERGLLALGVGQEFVVFHVARGGGAETVIHRILAQRVQPAGPIVGKHQATAVGQTLGDQAEHVAQLALAPHAGGDERRHGRERHLGGIDLGAHGHPAGVLPLHGDDVIHGVTAAQTALVVADDHGNPAVALVIQVVDGLGQLVLLDGNRQLVLALPLDLLDAARNGAAQGLDMALAATSVVLLFRFCHGANSPHLSWSGN